MSNTPPFQGWMPFYTGVPQTYPVIYSQYPINYYPSYPSYNHFMPMSQPCYTPLQNTPIQQAEPQNKQNDQKILEKKEQDFIKKQTVKKRLKQQKDISLLREKTQSCNCLKTGCMKEYCFCYRAGQPCGESCGCKFCKNTLNHKLFRPKKKKAGEIKCSCKNSQCSQKYCQCYLAGIKCGQHCKCNECKNCN